MVDGVALYTCPNCGNEHQLNASQLEFLAARGLDGRNTLCPECRANIRSTYAAWNSGRGQERPGREIHSTTCAECGVETQVPFIPREGRPVYCPACFQKQRNSARGSADSN